MTRRRSKIEEARTAAGWHQPADAPACRNCAHFRRDPERCVALHFATGYASLVAVAALAGLGNSVFHPADFTVLNHRVSQPRLGHAFSVHGLSGNLGWAAAPVFALLPTLN